MTHRYEGKPECIALAIQLRQRILSSMDQSETDYRDEQERRALRQVAPALTPGEWALKTAERADDTVAVDNSGALWIDDGDDQWRIITERHAVAALALHNQPFGFTQEDVAALEWRIEQSAYPNEADELRRIRDRVAALIPPPADFRE